MTDLLDIDDVEAQAREGWRLGEALCTRCGAYHQMWGILRVAGAVSGLSADRDLLLPLLDGLAGPGARVLVAGAADAGLFQLVVNAVRARPITVTVVDRCPAPIALLDRIATPDRVTLNAFPADLTAFDEPGAHDLILSHSMLPFVDYPTRIAILTRLRASLAPGGKLVLVVRTSPLSRGEAGEDQERAWFEQALQKVRAVPELVAFCGDALEPTLARVAATRRLRSYAFVETAEVVDMLQRGGFSVERHLPSRESGRIDIGGRPIAKQSHIFVAAPAARHG